MGRNAKIITLISHTRKVMFKVKQQRRLPFRKCWVFKLDSEKHLAFVGYWSAPKNFKRLVYGLWTTIKP